MTPDDLAHAEKLMRVSMTPEQRALAADSWNLNIGPFFARRDFPLGDESPGMVWNPVLQGTGRMPKKNRLVRSSWAARRPPTDDELAFAPVHALARWVQARQVSSVRLTALALARLERYQPQLNCTITLVREQALAEAEAADREIAHGKYRGPLHGIPYGAKDLLDSAGVRTTWGAEPFRNRVPKEDATVIARLRAAGAILVAKLSLGALALNDVWFGGRTSNPWVPRGGVRWVERRLGGGGLRRAGLVAIGSETFGSIVDPCMRCGTTGLRPTFGRVPRTGAMTLSWSHDKLGPIARSVEDTALVLAGVSGPDPADLSSLPSRFAFDATRPVKGLKLGVVPAWMGGPRGERRRAGRGEGPRAAGNEAGGPGLPRAALGGAAVPGARRLGGLLRAAHPLGGRRAAAHAGARRLAEPVPPVPLHLRGGLRPGRPAAAPRGEGVGRTDGEGGRGPHPPRCGTSPWPPTPTGHPCLVLPTGSVMIDQIRSDWLPPPGQQHPAVSPPRKMPSGVSLIGHLWDEGTLCSVGMALESVSRMSDAHPAGFV